MPSGWMVWGGYPQTIEKVDQRLVHGPGKRKRKPRKKR